ncbi:hypothetical protein GCM10010282_37030 [Streptomyces roseolus]|nr:hypothetical protein GCM10010282_37030 [Streptomyces roseolus]
MLPSAADRKYGSGIQLPVLMEPGTFAVEPQPRGSPRRRWEEIDPDDAAVELWSLPDRVEEDLRQFARPGEHRPVAGVHLDQPPVFAGQ